LDRTRRKTEIRTWEFAEEGDAIHVTFRHDNIATEELRDHSEPMWKMLLD
jgi:hypothetical protein